MEQTKIDFEEKLDMEESSPAFKLKITNLRKVAYTTNSPEESDYFKFRVGELLSRGSSLTTIYEVVSIFREPITMLQYDDWIKRLKKYNNTISDMNAKNFIDEYKKNGNFGACRVYVKPLIRGERELVKSRVVNFLEIDHIGTFRYNGYHRTDLNSLIRMRTSSISKYTHVINRATMKKAGEERLLTTLNNLQAKRDAIIAARIVSEAKEEVDQIREAA
jgi:hypothetical protein